MDDPNLTDFFKTLPAQVINEGTAFGPFSIRDYIQASPDEAVKFHFQATLSNGEPLPSGLSCTDMGVISGTPGKGTQGYYEIDITADNQAGVFHTATFSLTIEPSLAAATTAEAAKAEAAKAEAAKAEAAKAEAAKAEAAKAEAAKAVVSDKKPAEVSPLPVSKKRVWEALEKNLAIPDLAQLMELPVTINEVYYLLERWAMLTIWDAFNLDPAGEKHPITLEGASPHYHVYDCGSCLVAAPKDLFTYKRTLEDALNTARAMACEVYKRNWTIEFAGFDKMVRAAWLELQLLADKHGHALDILHFEARPEDLKLYAFKLGGNVPTKSSSA